MSYQQQAAAAGAPTPAQPTNIVVKQNVYKFLLEDNKTKPTLLPESQYKVVKDGVITELDLRDLFWGYNRAAKPKIDLGDADIKGYSLLQECYNPKTGEMTLDGKVIKFSLHDPVTNQNFRISSFGLSMCAWFDDDEFTYKTDAFKFGKLIHETKNLTAKVAEEIRDTAQEQIKERAQSTISKEMREATDDDREPTYQELIEELEAEGYTIHLTEGRMAFFEGEEVAERLFRLLDKKGEKYIELELPKDEADLDLDEEGSILYKYQDEGEDRQLIYNREKQTIKIRKYEAPAVAGTSDSDSAGSPGAQGEPGNADTGPKGATGNPNADAGAIATASAAADGSEKGQGSAEKK